MPRHTPRAVERHNTAYSAWLHALSLRTVYRLDTGAAGCPVRTAELDRDVEAARAAFAAVYLPAADGSPPPPGLRLGEAPPAPADEDEATLAFAP